MNPKHFAAILVLVVYGTWCSYHLILHFHHIKLYEFNRAPDPTQIDLRFRRSYFRNWLDTQEKNSPLILGNSQFYGHGVPSELSFSHLLNSVVNAAITGCQITCIKDVTGQLKDMGFKSPYLLWNLDLNYFSKLSAQNHSSLENQPFVKLPYFVSQYAGKYLRRDLTERIRLSFRPERLNRFQFGNQPENYLTLDEAWQTKLNQTYNLFKDLSQKVYIIPSPMSKAHVIHLGYNPEQIQSQIHAILKEFESLGALTCQMENTIYWDESNFQDLIHLTPKGHKKMADLIQECIP